MLISVLIPYIARLPNGKRRSHTGAANWSAPHGREYQSGTTGGSKLKRQTINAKERNVTVKTHALTNLISQLLRINSHDAGAGTKCIICFIIDGLSCLFDMRSYMNRLL